MPKKFFDIIPPNQEKPQPQVIEKEEELEVKPKKKRYLLKGVIGLVIVLIVIGFISSFFFSKVEVKIWPKSEEISFSDTITIDLNINEINLAEKIIPAQMVENEKFGSQSFPATGKATTEGKASGKITVYNAYSTSSRSLIPSRFVSADGKLFWSVEKITIPGARNGVLGEKEVRVEAAETGPDYNISPTTFALPALAGTALYTTIYAKSFEPMTGGHKGEVNQVTEKDLESAETTLLNNLKRESIEALRSSLSEDFVLPEQTVIQDILKRESSHSVGTGVDSFTFEGGVKSNGIVFKKSDIESFIKEIIGSNLDKGEIILEESLDINYVLKDIDMENGRITVNLDVKVLVYDEISLEKVKKAIMGKSLEEAEIFLNSLAGVERIELNSWPFVSRNVPDVPNKVEVELKFD